MPFGIMKRNGFKNKQQETLVKREEDDDSFEDSNRPLLTKMSSLKPFSKARHLWVNYGRRIVDYVISQTKGDMQEKVKQLTGRLNSKRDFEKVFQIVEFDSLEEKTFKLWFGKLAIFFAKCKCFGTFDDSKYKDDMIAQRHVVAAWIERLIGS